MRIYKKGYISISHHQVRLYANICAIHQWYIFFVLKINKLGILFTNPNHLCPDKFLVLRSWGEPLLLGGSPSLTCKALQGCSWSPDLMFLFVSLLTEYTEDCNLTFYMTCNLKGFQNLPNWPYFEISLVNIKYFDFLKKKKVFF